MENENIEQKEIHEVMPQLFLTYAEDVVKNRAIPRLDDGLKPVQRRILYDMYINGLASNRPHHKCAKTVGDVLSRFHSHGDQSVYDAMIVMAQDFSMRYPLVDIHGNSGSFTGDPAAAYRYTEGRLSPVAELMLEDIDKNTVTMEPNYDNTTTEPVMLGGYFPNAICNPAIGIAVGIATCFAPHYAGDVFKAADIILEDMENGLDTNEENLINIIQAPDFPTGGTIINPEAIPNIYRTGRGRIILRGKYRIEENSRHKAIVFYELPYKIAYNVMMDSLAKLQEEITEIKDIRDESSARSGIRIVIEIRKGIDESWIIQKIFKKTELQSSYNCNFVAIMENGRPAENISLKQMLNSYVSRCCLTFYNSCIYDKEKWQKRLGTVNAMLFAAEHATDIIRIIQESDEPVQALIDTYQLTKEWAEIIYDIRLRNIAKLSTQKLTEEAEQLETQLTDINVLLQNQTQFLEAVRAKIKAVSESKIFENDKRRTTIEALNPNALDERAFVKEETIVLTHTNSDMVRAIRLTDFQTRKGVSTGTSTKLKEDEVIVDMLTLSTKDTLLCFTNNGKCHILPVYKIPITSKNAHGRYLSAMLQLDDNEHVVCIIPANPDTKDGKVLLFVTKNGYIKKMDISQLSSVYKSTKCIKFREGDSLQQVLLCDTNSEVIIISSGSKAAHISLENVTTQSRAGSGVVGMKLESGASVISACVCEADKSFVTVSRKGYVKRMQFDDFPLSNRGAKGVAIGGKKNDSLVAAYPAADNQTLVIASKDGMITRLPVSKYSVHARKAGGNYGMKLADEDYVVSASVTDTDQESSEE